MRVSSRLDVLRRGFGRGVFPHQLGWLLDLPGRGLIMPAETVATRLPVAPDAHVLELGPGTGYYSEAVARRVPRGALTLVDIQPEMLARCAERLTAAGLTNHRTQLTDGRALPFDDAAFDAAFMVTVFGEIAERDAMVRELHRVLRPGGVLSITEHHPDPDFEPAASVAACLAQHGFRPEAPQGWRWAYTLNARRP